MIFAVFVQNSLERVVMVCCKYSVDVLWAFPTERKVFSCLCWAWDAVHFWPFTSFYSILLLWKQAGSGNRRKMVLPSRSVTPFDGPTLVCFYCSIDILRSSLLVFESLALFDALKTDWKQKLPVGSTAKRKFKYCWVGRPPTCYQCSV